MRKAGLSMALECERVHITIILDFIWCGRRFEHPVRSFEGRKTIMVGVPGHVNGTIDYNGETDDYRVYLHDGDSYEFDVYGKHNGDHDSTSPGRFDPTLTLSYHGHQVAYNDDADGPNDRNSHIDYTADHSGWYSLTVAGFGNEEGRYTLHTDYSHTDHSIV
jgi:hypothetical protein